ncbi:MAG TPA: carboxypeptidase-like regulatory domain-containing protein, partial [Steroidobacteraceae bacterium]|nr:carboxypeptidase-like regulatory domain-containing protein [Steroidobacteraceae bacterium]
LSEAHEIAMRRGYEVHGRVVELSSGAAVAGAYISFRPLGVDDDFWHKPYAQSQADGSFSLDGIPAGDMILTVQELQHAWRHVTVTVNEKTPPQEIALSTGGTIAGAVMTAAGAPVKSFVSLRGPGEFDFVVETTETGQFRFEHLAASRYTLAASTDAGRVSHDMRLGEDEIKSNVVLVLNAGRRISGTVSGVRPQHRDRVQVVAEHESKPDMIRATVDQHGTYSLHGVPPGNVVVSVFGPSLQFRKRVIVPSEADVTLDLEYPLGARLTGVVTQGGKPVRDTFVRLQRVGDKSEVLYQATTSEQGQYEIEDLPPGEYFLRAKGDIVRRITIVADAVQNIEMSSLRLSARVVEHGGAEPVVGAHVYARGTGPATAGVRSNTETDDSGRFELTGLEPGEIVLIVYKPGYELHREKIIYSAPTANHAITLRRSAGVEVKMKPRNRRSPSGFMLTQSVPGSVYVVDLWMPLDREGTGHVPSALVGATFQIGGFSGQPVVIEKWDGKPFDLQ